MTRRVRPVLGVLALVVACGACGVGSAGSADADRELTVLAAASLTETFTELEQRYEAEHDGVDVRLAFDSSATLALQVAEGAPADVLATADERTMQAAVDAGVIDGEPVVFATNRMQLVVPAGNPAEIEEFADIDNPEVSYVTCVESAPCGAVAGELLDLNEVDAEPRSFEVDVKAVLTKVTLGEADAGLVYATDALAAGPEVEALGIPGSGQVTNRYPIGVVDGTEHPSLAREWVDLVRSAEARAVLEDAGFGAPR